MTRVIVDWLLKVLALAITGAWVFAYWERRDDGRYAVYQQPPESVSEAILDTRTGTLYYFQRKDDALIFGEIHPQTRTVLGGPATIIKGPLPNR